MPRPKSGYGPGIVGVTTVLEMWGQNKRALMHWAWTQGMQGIDYRQTKDAAADVGTAVHSLIEAHLKGLPTPDISHLSSDDQARARQAFDNFISWLTDNRFELLQAEVSLVDQDLGFGGTIDLVSLKRRPAIVDWKTSTTGKAYPEHWVQLAAYQYLWETHHDVALAGGCHLILLDKESGAFTHAHKYELGKYWEIFKHLLAIYKLTKEVAK